MLLLVMMSNVKCGICGKGNSDSPSDVSISMITQILMVEVVMLSLVMMSNVKCGICGEGNSDSPSDVSVSMVT